jgi:hypothetical protein
MSGSSFAFQIVQMRKMMEMKMRMKVLVQRKGDSSKSHSY